MNQLKCPRWRRRPARRPATPLATRSLTPPRRQLLLRHVLAGRAGGPRQRRTVLGGLRPERLIAVGESQSAGRLVTYINAVHPLVDVYDGFLVHSRGGGGAPLSQAPLPARRRPGADLASATTSTSRCWSSRPRPTSGGLRARQPDSDLYRLWEVAGTAHFDQYGLSHRPTDIGKRESVAEWFDLDAHPTNQPNPASPATRRSTPAPTFVLRAAIAHLDRWVADGTPPPVAPRLDTSVGRPYALDRSTATRWAGSAPLQWTLPSRRSAASARAASSSAACSAPRRPTPRAARRALPRPRRVRLTLEPGDPGHAAGWLHRRGGRAAPAAGRGPVRHPLIEAGTA